jgi:hypothetical protein
MYLPTQMETTVRFAAFPRRCQNRKLFRDLGLDKAVDQVTENFTRATLSAVRAAKPIFLQSVKEMSIKDAANILVTDNNYAATEYFRMTMSPELMIAFRPIVDSTINVEAPIKTEPNSKCLY